jgi:hypothetical protein
VSARNRRAIRLVAGLAAVPIAWGVADASRELSDAHTAYGRMHDLLWRRGASQDELRRTAQRSLGWPLGDPHEAFLVLGSIGTRESIPAIRARLRWRPSGPFAPCTWGHGDEALERIVTRS